MLPIATTCRRLVPRDRILSVFGAAPVLHQVSVEFRAHALFGFHKAEKHEGVVAYLPHIIQNGKGLWLGEILLYIISR
jgi:hypothetical protein